MTTHVMQAALPPSRTESEEILPSVVGVDTVALSVPCAEEPVPVPGDRTIGEYIDPGTGEITQTFQSRPLHLGTGLHHARLVHRRRGWCVMFECSVPKVLFGHNNDPSPLNGIDRVLDLAASRLAEDHGIATVRGGAWIRRLDVVRDFDDVPDPDLVLRRLLHVVPDRQDVQCSAYFGTGGQVTDVVRNTRDYRIRLYDKAEQTRSSEWPARAGQLRYEVQLRGSALRGLRKLADLTGAGLGRLAEHFFGRMRFDSPLGESEPDVESLRRAWPTLSLTDQRALPMVLGLRRLDRAGVMPVQDAKTRRKYRHLPTGVTTASDGASIRRHLDFQSGRLVPWLDPESDRPIRTIEGPFPCPAS